MVTYRIAHNIGMNARARAARLSISGLVYLALSMHLKQWEWKKKATETDVKDQQRARIYTRKALFHKPIPANFNQLTWCPDVEFVLVLESDSRRHTCVKYGPIQRNQRQLISHHIVTTMILGEVYADFGNNLIWSPFALALWTWFRNFAILRLLWTSHKLWKRYKIQISVEIALVSI